MEMISDSMSKEKYDETAELLNSIPTTMTPDEIKQKANIKQSKDLCLERYFDAGVSMLTRFILSLCIMVIIVY